MLTTDPVASEDFVASEEIARKISALQRIEMVVSLAGNGDTQWYFSQVKGTLDDDVTEGELLPIFISETLREVRFYLLLQALKYTDESSASSVALLVLCIIPIF